MQQLTFVEPGKLEWWEVDDPRLAGDREALVRPLAVATCDLDSLIVRGTAPFEGPFPFGHEAVAEVVETGDAAGGFEPGDLVTVPFQISCGECAPCREGRTGNCTGVPRLSMYGLGSLGGDWGGFLSDTVRVPFADHMLVRFPDGVEPAAAASVSDNISDGWRTVGPFLAERPEAEVLVVGGAGSIGLYSAGIAAALGSPRVDYVDHDEDRLERAKRLGANAIKGYPDRLGPYPVTVDASADPGGLACAIRSAGPDGVCTSIGIYWVPETPVPLFEAYTKGLTFHTGRVHARPVIPEVLALIASGRLHPELVTDRVVPWDDAAEALADHGSKTVITRRPGTQPSG
jgi:threonine dehydrogenase-like Zn-dependent dehydrogenase